MEPEKSNNLQKADEAFRKKEAEIEGQPRTVSAPIEEPAAPSLRLADSAASSPEPAPNFTPQGDTAQGYNPNLNLPKKDGLEGPPPPEMPVLNNQSSASPEPAPQPEPQTNPREGAPDIGKNYGDSLGTPPVNAHPTTPAEGEQTGHPMPNQPQGQAQGQNQQPGQAERPNELEKAKQEKDAEEASKKQKDKDKDKDNSASETNPEAPNQGKKPATPKEGPNDQTGNGYGALKRPQSSSPNADSTERARRNLEHNNRVKKGSQEESGRKPTAATNTPRQANNSEGSGLSNIGSRIKNAITNGLSKRGSKSSVGKGDGKNSNKLSNAFKGGIKRKILAFFATHPFAAVIIILVIFIIILMLIAVIEDDASGSGGKKGTKCTYNLNGVTLSGSVELSNLQVELINCDGTASNYTVLETVDFEKYALGVALAEIGPDSPDEAIKTQIIAARNFALTRNSGMCPGNPDSCFYGYNTSTGKIRMRACEADQVYWDYEKDIYRQDRGSISIYSPEITSGTLWKSALSDTRKQEVLALANEVKGKVLVDSTDKVIPTPYVASTSEQFLSLANQGKTYDEILKTVYDTNADISEATCSSYGNIDYGDYVLSSDGTEILHQPLDDFLVAKGTSLEEFNNLIASNVENAGYGTRAGVVAAAVTLIGELGNNYGVKVPYYWGGGHYDGVVDGALGYWGSTECHTYANGQSYNFCGLDCSGFVPWAIKNGGFNIAQNLAGKFQNLQGARRVSLSSSSPVLEPGDLLESSGHIVLVVGVDEATSQYICAEASGNSSGVLFTRRSYTPSGYWGVKMDGFYDTHARS